MTNREIAALCAKEVVAAKRDFEMNCVQFMSSDVTKIILRVLDNCGVGESAKAKSPAKMADEEWVCSLEVEPSLAGVDIRREIGKAQFWAKNNRRLATRKFILNWLAKADRTLTVQMDGQTSKKVVTVDAYTEPPNWKPIAARLYPDTDYFNGRAWGDVALDYRKHIISKLLSA